MRRWTAGVAALGATPEKRARTRVTSQVRLEVADAASKRRLCFSSFLAHGVDAARCKAKVKAEKGEVVLVLRKADPDDAWARLSRDVNFDAGDQVGAPLPPADEGDGGYQ